MELFREHSWFLSSELVLPGVGLGWEISASLQDNLK